VVKLDDGATVPAANPPRSEPGATTQQAQPAQPSTVLVAQSLGPAGGQRAYVVQPGDELKQIAAAYGVSMARILATNDVPDPDSLSVGQTLLIPNPA
jgi:LysM repeat protein